MIYLTYALVTLLAYLLGSIPTGYLVGRLHGVDVTKHGSGKTGGTNVARLVGWPRTLPVAICDPAKAILAILIARFVTHNEVMAVVAALAALAGHNWSIYLGFRGGRGVGPVLGTLIVFTPWIALIAGLSGLAIAIASRFVSLGSVLGCALAIALGAVGYAVGGVSGLHLAFTVVACGLIIAQHKDNIGRLLAGNERRLGERIPVTPEKRG